MQNSLPLLLLLLILAGALIGPIILVLKWRSRPWIALLIGLILLFLSLASFMFIGSHLANLPDETRFGALKGVGYMTLIFGFPILKLVQWRKLRQVRALNQTLIETTF